MLLKALTDGSVTGTGELTVESRVFGGMVITTDGSTLGTVIVRKDDANGKRLMKIATTSSMWVAGPITMEGTDQLYFSVSGSGCEAQFYEWVT